MFFQTNFISALKLLDNPAICCSVITNSHYNTKFDAVLNIKMYKANFKARYMNKKHTSK